MSFLDPIPMSSVLIGHENPYGEYPAPVVPIGRDRKDRLFAAYPHRGNIQWLRQLDPKTFVPLLRVQEDFNFANDRLFAYSEGDVVSYPVAGEEEFLRNVLPKVSPDIKAMLERYLSNLQRAAAGPVSVQEFLDR